MTLMCDYRWVGPHGIGRFASEVLKGLPSTELACGGSPADPQDCLRLAWALRGARAGDTFFSPGYNAPWRFRGDFVFTIHDLNHIDRPENASRLKSIYYEAILKPACHRARRILTVSEFSRQRIVDWSGVDPDRVVNVGNGVDPSFTPDVEPHQPGRPYFLCVGNRKGHKNEARVLRALARLPDRTMRLILTGAPSPELLDLAGALGIADRVSFAGRTDDAQLCALYVGAAALVFPSLYEGFGLPVVEAFACGTPVITSDCTSLPEVAGGCAVLVDPASEEQIAAAMERVVTDTDLRARLRAAGLRRARDFTWTSVVARARQVILGPHAANAGATAGTEGNIR